MDVGAWLRGLGCGQYEAAFRDNAIDATALASLTADDLKEIGVGPVGHRKRLLEAIAALGAGIAAAVAPASGAERRHVTVMFVDLVGSTGLSADMDPEDLRRIIADYQRCVTDVVGRFGGFVAKYMGDGVLVYFGYPLARENDAERAVGAALEIVAGVAALDRDVPLKTRVGIASGLVVIGDLLGSGEARERGIVGEAPNLAARLQSIAEPDTVIICGETRKLVAKLFDLADLGRFELKGLPRPVGAWAALRPRPVQSRFEALHVDGMTALVGRDEELEILRRRWAKAKDGAGQVALLAGEAGIGKSRLTAAVRAALADEPHGMVRCFCSPQHSDSAFHPLVACLEAAARLTREDPPSRRLDKLDALLAEAGTNATDAALCAEMLSLPNDGRYPEVHASPQQRRLAMIEAFIAHLEAKSRRNPLLVVFEDLHWIDPTSLEMVVRLVDRIASLPVLLIATFRPEFEAPWTDQPHVSRLPLRRLDRREIAAVIDLVAGDTALPEAVRQEILERTDGVPLFVEEMTKAIVETGQVEAARTVRPLSPPGLAIPANLYGSLMARLDRLGPAAAEVARIAAAIGREFSFDLLLAVAGRAEAAVAESLDALVKAGLLFRLGPPPSASFVFKHALVRDAAYGTMLREPRRDLHARIAEALELHFTERMESQPEIAARHYTEAGDGGKAARLWAKAGRRSLLRSALVEAAEHLTRALDHIDALPETPDLRREQIALRIELASALMHTKGHAAPETLAAFEKARSLMDRAQALNETPDDPLVLFSVLYGAWVGSRMRFDGARALALADQFLQLAEKQGASGPAVVGHHLKGITLVLTGRLSEGKSSLDRAIALYEPAEHRALARLFAHDCRVSARCWRAIAVWMLGQPDAALSDAEQAVREARDIGHAATLMYALSHASLALAYRGDHSLARSHATELLALAAEKKAPFWESYGTLLLGCLALSEGDSAVAATLLEAGIAAMRATGATGYAPWYLSNLALAHARGGRRGVARQCVEEALAAAEASAERWCEAEIHRIAGEISLMRPERDLDGAAAHFDRAIQVARGQRASSLELRAALDLAAVWCERGRREQAVHVVARLYGSFSEGRETADLARAREFLEAPG